jgi:hypothetical protein
VVAEALLSRWTAVVADSYSSSSLLYFIVSSSSVISFVLSTIVFPLCSGSQAVQLVTTKRKNGAAAGGSPSFFVYAWLPLSVSIFASSFVSHHTGVVIDEGEDNGS